MFRFNLERNDIRDLPDSSPIAMPVGDVRAAIKLIASQEAEIRRFKDVVVILPESAEPMAGDLVLVSGLPYLVCVSFLNGELVIDIDGLNLLVESAKIIQRNGKPVIYEQALNNQN